MKKVFLYLFLATASIGDLRASTRQSWHPGTLYAHIAGHRWTSVVWNHSFGLLNAQQQWWTGLASLGALSFGTGYYLAKTIDRLLSRPSVSPEAALRTRQENDAFNAFNLNFIYQSSTKAIQERLKMSGKEWLRTTQYKWDDIPQDTLEILELNNIGTEVSEAQLGTVQSILAKKLAALSSLWIIHLLTYSKNRDVLKAWAKKKRDLQYQEYFDSFALVSGGPQFDAASEKAQEKNTGLWYSSHIDAGAPIRDFLPSDGLRERLLKQNSLTDADIDREIDALSVNQTDKNGLVFALYDQIKPPRKLRNKWESTDPEKQAHDIFYPKISPYCAVYTNKAHQEDITFHSAFTRHLAAFDKNLWLVKPHSVHDLTADID